MSDSSPSGFGLAARKAIKSLLPETVQVKLKENIIKSRHSKEDVKPKVPEELHFHVTSICNARCTFCAYTYVDTPKDFMTLDVFKKGVDDYAALGGTAINFTPLVGDALIDPGLYQKVEYARKEAKIKKIGFATNAILLNRNDNYKKLVDYGVDWLQISSPGLDDEAYKRVYQTNQYPQILEGIKNLLNYKKEKNSPIEVFIILRIDRKYEDTLQDEGYKEILPYIKEGLIEVRVDDEYYLDMDSWCGQITDDKLTGLMRLKKVDKEKPRIPCFRMIWNLAILPQGHVRVCSCRFFEKEVDDMVVGNITQESLKDILTSSTWQSMLSNIIESGKWPRACQECTYYRPMGVL